MEQYRDESRELLKKKFPLWLAQRMERKGMTQVELAESVGMTQQGISRYLRADGVPQTTILKKILFTLNVHPDAFWDEMRG